MKKLIVAVCLQTEHRIYIKSTHNVEPKAGVYKN